MNSYEKQLTPLIYKITDKSSIVLKSEYDLLSIDRDKIQKRYDQERDLRLRAENNVSDLEAKYKELLVRKDNTNEKGKVEMQKDDEEGKFAELIAIFEARHLVEQFETLIYIINNKEPISEMFEGLRYFVTIGLIRKGTVLSGSDAFYEFTPLGEELLKYYRENYMFKPSINKVTWK